VPTAYKSQQGRGGFYRLDSLVFFAHNRHLGVGPLLKACRDAGLPAVSFIDRKVRRPGWPGMPRRGRWRRILFWSL